MRSTLEYAPNFVYRAFDAEGRALYVGCTSNLKARMSQHRCRAVWPALIADLVVTEYRWRPQAFAAERAEILRLDPIYNVNGRHPFSVGIQRAIERGALPPEPTRDDVLAWIQSLPDRRPTNAARVRAAA